MMNKMMLFIIAGLMVLNAAQWYMYGGNFSAFATGMLLSTTIKLFIDLFDNRKYHY